MFCSVRGREESDGSESGEDSIVNRTEAEKVVSLSTIPLPSSSFCVKAGIHASYPHGTVSTWDSTARSVVWYCPICVTTCVSDPSPGGCSPEDGDCSVWRQGQVCQGDIGRVDHHRGTEGSHSKVAA